MSKDDVWWSAKRLDALVADAKQSASSIEHAFRHSGRTQTASSGRLTVWGQWVGPPPSEQWGLLGTASAVQVLAATDPAGALVQEASAVMPDNKTTGDSLFDEKRNRGDFKNIIRLASIAESLRPDVAQVSLADRPALVDEILAMRQGRDFWDADSAADGHVPGGGDDFTTAFCVHALRRFEDPGALELQASREWLAGRTGGARTRPDHLALMALALTPPDLGSVSQRQSDARKECATQLIARSRKAPIAVDRPLFSAYRVGERNDYTFLSPEILMALFLIRSEEATRAPDRVLRVVKATVAQVQPTGAFQTAQGDQASVDQLWAFRLLREFAAAYEKPGSPERLRRAARKPSQLTIAGLALVALIAIVLYFLIVEKTDEVLALVGGAVLTAFPAATLLRS